MPDSHRLMWKSGTRSPTGCRRYEGDIDSSHTSFLHSFLHPAESQKDNGSAISPTLKALDKAPELIVAETDYGIYYGARRAMSTVPYYWRVTQAILPSFRMIAASRYPSRWRAWVPIDDERTMTFYWSFRPERPLTDETWRCAAPARVPTSWSRHCSTRSANMYNDYLVDRQLQRTKTYTGIRW